MRSAVRKTFTFISISRNGTLGFTMLMEKIRQRLMLIPDMILQFVRVFLHTRILKVCLQKRASFFVGMTYHRHTASCFTFLIHCLIFFLFFFFLITVRPEIERFAVPDSVQLGQRLSITCTVIKGDPPIAIKWIKDGLVLQNNDNDGHHNHHRRRHSNNKNIMHTSSLTSNSVSTHHQNIVSSSSDQNYHQQQPNDVRIFDLADYSSTLLFPAVREHHRGNYTCAASNVVGQDEHTTSLVISGQ